MRIIYFGIYNHKAGLENYAKNLISTVIKSNNKIKYTIISEYHNYSFREYFEKLGCESVIVPNWHRHPLAFYRSFYKILRTHEKDCLLQLNICSYRNILLFLAAKKARIKTIIVGHYTSLRGHPSGIFHYFNRFIFRKFGTKVTNSDDVTRFMFGKRTDAIFIANGIDGKPFAYNSDYKEELLSQLQICDKKIIGHIGRISEQKNQIFTLKVFKTLLKKCDSLHLVLIGSVISKKPIHFLKANNLEDKVTILAPREDIYKFYSLFDVVVLPSTTEGLSLQLLEDAASGIPSILSCNVPRLTINTSNLVYLPLVADLWVSNILSVLSTNKERNAINGIKGTCYDIEECACSYLSLYNSILEEKG